MGLVGVCAGWEEGGRAFEMGGGHWPAWKTGWGWVCRRLPGERMRWLNVGGEETVIGGGKGGAMVAFDGVGLAVLLEEWDRGGGNSFFGEVIIHLSMGEVRGEVEFGGWGF